MSLRHWLIGALGTVLTVSAVWYSLHSLRPPAIDASVTAKHPLDFVKLEPGLSDSIRVPDDVAARLGVTTASIVEDRSAVPLLLSGTLTLDPERFATVRARFGGEVVELPGPGPQDSGAYGLGDSVASGALLAVVWSSDLGEKKSDLVDALSQLHHDSAALERLNSVAGEGAIPERTLRDLERMVEADRIAVDRASRTLAVLRVAEDEIQMVREEAQQIIAGQPSPQDELVSRWARIEVRSPFAGAILERDVARGQLVERDDDLFKIGDLTRLRVVAYAYEEDLPRLDALSLEERGWRVSIPASPDTPPAAGRFQRIGQIIDPSQHTALVTGWVDNPQGRLRVGQFIKASIDLPAPPGQLRVAASSIVERGDERLVLVRPDPAQPVFQLRRVRLLRRDGDSAFVASGEGAEIAAGEQVVTQGAVELLAALSDLRAESKSAPQGGASTAEAARP